MSELRELYQEVILDHNKNPRNFHKMETATHEAAGHNPLCGDNVTIYLDIKDGIINDISFEGSGCAISKSSASVMTTLLKGKTQEEAEKYFDIFHKLVASEEEIDLSSPELSKLAVFSGVREFPARVKCASLAWHTVNAAMHAEKEPVSTE